MPVQPQPSAGYGPGLTYPSGGYPIPGEPQQGGGFLRSAMQTAAGVAAGALAFEGVESLMHGFGHAAGYGSEFAGPGFGAAAYGQRPEEIVNNYYGDVSPHEHTGDIASTGVDRRDDLSGHPQDLSQLRNTSDSGDGGRLQDASYVTANADDSNADDLSGTTDSDYSASPDDSMLADDVGSDQDSGGDDSGGFDSGGDSGF